MTSTNTQPPADTALESADPYCLSPEAVTAALAGAPWQRYVVIGDSIAEGVREAVPGYTDSGWADRVADGLRGVRPDLQYRNLGKRDLVSSKVRSTQLEPALEFRPDLAAVVAGGNDILGKTFDEDAVETELARIISSLRSIGCTVVTMGLFDITQSPYVPEKYRAVMQERLRLLADRTRAVSFRMGCLYVDLPAHPSGAEEIYASDGL
ncbi:MAG: SGNH/GDSL hydrolase family protein, partial [Streptomycetaceae bacterium]|nr:SGNH/GDSL hydrolase family protein [Streptomycetaceae bacterium]